MCENDGLKLKLLLGDRKKIEFSDDDDDDDRKYIEIVYTIILFVHLSNKLAISFINNLSSFSIAESSERGIHVKANRIISTIIEDVEEEGLA